MGIVLYFQVILVIQIVRAKDDEPSLLPMFGLHKEPACCVPERPSTLTPDKFFAGHLMKNKPAVFRKELVANWKKWNSDIHLGKSLDWTIGATLEQKVHIVTAKTSVAADFGVDSTEGSLETLCPTLEKKMALCISDDPSMVACLKEAPNSDDSAYCTCMENNPQLQQCLGTACIKRLLTVMCLSSTEPEMVERTKTMSEYINKKVYMRPGTQKYLRAELAGNHLLKGINVPQYLQSPNFFRGLTSASMTLSGGGSLGPMKFDLTDSLTCQLDGKRLIHLVSPGKAKDFLEDGIPRTSINLEHFDTARYPDAAAALFYSVTLKPGDCMYIPSMWLYHSRGKRSVRNLDVTMRFSIWPAGDRLTNVPDPANSDFDLGVRWTNWTLAEMQDAHMNYTSGIGPHPYSILSARMAKIMAESKRGLRDVGSSPIEPSKESQTRTFWDAFDQYGTCNKPAANTKVAKEDN